VVAEVDPAGGDRDRVPAAKHQRGGAPGERRGDDHKRDRHHGGGSGMPAGEGGAAVGGHQPQRGRRPVLADELLTDLGQGEGPGEHAEHLGRVESPAHEQQNGRHQDHQPDPDGFRLADVAGQLCQGGQRAAAVMRGNVLIGPQVPAGHRTCLRQFAEQQHQRAQPGPGEEPAQASAATEWVPGRHLVPVRRGGLAAWIGVTGTGHERVVLPTVRSAYFYKTVEDNRTPPQGEQRMN
jgi:hypothetical protein